jgi:hypothetical protein
MLLAQHASYPSWRRHQASRSLTLALPWTGGVAVFSLTWCFDGGRLVRTFSSSIVFSLPFLFFVEVLWAGEKRGFGPWQFVVARVDGRTKLWRPESMFHSDWTYPLKLFELIVSMSQSDRWVVDLSGACWGPIQPTNVPSCMVCGPESFRVLCSHSCAVDWSELYGFWTRFSLQTGSTLFF